MNKSEVNDFAIDAWFEKAQGERVLQSRILGFAVLTWLTLDPDADRRSTLIFAASVPHAVNLANAFRARGIDARFVSMATKQADRAELYRAFRAGEYPVLINYGILTEGGESRLRRSQPAIARLPVPVTEQDIPTPHSRLSGDRLRPPRPPDPFAEPLSPDDRSRPSTLASHRQARLPGHRLARLGGEEWRNGVHADAVRAGPGHGDQR